MKRKILAAFLLTLIAIAFALTIAHFSFSEMMGTVDKLSAPNEKLLRLNKVFEEITMLDQQQRAEAIQNPEKPVKYFLDQTGYLQMMIDTLSRMDWDKVQKKRLRSLGEILDQRNQIFVSYLKVKADLAENKDFSMRLDTLSMLLRQGKHSTDSIVTTQRQTITRYVQQDSIAAAETRKSFLKKLFGKKSKEKAVENPKAKLQEKTDVVVDTVAIAHTTGIDIEDIQRRMRDLEVDQRSQRKRLQNKELDLIHANGLFINQLLNTLHEVESEELRLIRVSNESAAHVFHQGISRMNILMLTFFISIALLVYFILIDISKSNYYRKQLEMARDHAEELGKIKQRFLANMSHEIRTPLQSIIGFAEQLRIAKGSNNEAVDAIHSSSEHLLHIVNEVLDYSRIASGSLTIVKEPFKMLQLVREIESAMRVQAHKKNLTFITDTEKASEYNLSGDAFRLRQILYNLLGNAIKFTPSGFIKLAVRTKEEESKVTCIFEITDSGIGMTPEELKKVFNQFEQANPEITKTYGGTGLGLSIVKSLVEAQGGTLDVNSTHGSGSTFKVVITYDKQENEKPVVVSPKSNDSTSVDALDVIVIDDDAMILKLCGLILKKNGIRHRAYQDAGEVISLKPSPDVTHILMDIRMPGINGVDLCRKLKPEYPDSKFVALTAHVLPEERATLYEQGFDLVLSKPFHEKDLLTVFGIQPVSLPDKDESMPDFKQLREMTMGDEMLFNSIIQQFLEESNDDILIASQELEQGNTRALREVVHKLAGRLAQMGITKLSKQYQAIEKKLVAGGRSADVQDELTNIISETRGLLNSIGKNQKAHLN